MLKFSQANAKTDALYGVLQLRQFLFDNRKVYSIDLPAGYTCPGAKICMSRAVPRQDDPSRFTIRDGPHCEFRCFSASQEVIYPPTRRLRKRNLDALRSIGKSGGGVNRYRDLILKSLPTNAGVIRYHVGGDFYCISYLRGAIAAAKQRPDVLFYAYTKSLHFLKGIVLPDNFRLTLSRGGKYDHHTEWLDIRQAVVVYSEEEAAQMGLPVDKDDSHAASPNKGNSKGGSFALLVHGVQPANTVAAAALSALRGKGSYARK